MIIFTLRRLLLLLVTLFFLTLVSFSLLYFTPHAPLSGASLTDAYRFYLHSLLQGDFGVSSINGQTIVGQLREVVPATLELCILGFLLALFCGIPMGIAAGMMRGRWPDGAISTLALLGYSMPVFWLALLLMLFSPCTWAGCRSPGAMTCSTRCPISAALPWWMPGSPTPPTADRCCSACCATWCCRSACWRWCR